VFIQHPPSLPGPIVRVDDKPIEFDRREITGPGLGRGWWMYTLPIERIGGAQTEPHTSLRDHPDAEQDVEGGDDGEDWQVTLEWHAHV
jgi:hypothetical protein